MTMETGSLSVDVQDSGFGPGGFARPVKEEINAEWRIMQRLFVF